MTPIRKALFGAHVMAIKLCSVRLVSSPKIHVLLVQNKLVVLVLVNGGGGDSGGATGDDGGDAAAIKL
jgi:hypothetical protein